MNFIYFVIVSVVVMWSSFSAFGIAFNGDNNQKNLITEEERRAADIPNDSPDLTKSDTKKRALFSIGHKHSSYPSSGSGYGGGYGYGHSGSGYPSSSGGDYHHGSSGGGYHQSSVYGHAYGPPTGHGFDYHSNNDYHGHGGGSIGHGGSFGGHGLALKSILLPLAGIALLGAAAAITTNPVLLQLGVVNGRKKRSVEDKIFRNVYPANPRVRPQKILH